MKKRFYLFSLMYLLILQNQRCTETNQEIKTLKNAGRGALIGLATYYLTNFLRREFKTLQTNGAPILKNLTTFRFNFNIKTLPWDALDLTYACAGGAYMKSINDKESTMKINICRLWFGISLAQGIRKIRSEGGTKTLDAYIPILNTALAVSKIKPESFSKLTTTKPTEGTKAKTEDSQTASTFKSLIKKLPLQRYKKLYLTFISWIIWQIYKQETRSIKITENSIFEIFQAFKYGLFFDLVTDGPQRDTSLIFFITDFLSKLPENSYQIGSSLSGLGTIEGLATGIQKII